MAAPVLESISRDIGVAAGGTTIVLRGRGFIGGETVTFGGNAATIVVVAPNKVTVTTPAGSASETAVDVVLTNGNGSSTLSAAFEYLPPPTVTWVDEKFESSSFGVLIKEGVPTIVSLPSPRGSGASTKCVNCESSTNGQEVSVGFDLLNNPYRDSVNGLHGVFHRFFLYIPSATLGLTTVAGQIKILLSRVANTIPETVMVVTGVNGQSPSPALCTFVDNGISNFLGSMSSPTLGDGIWLEVLLQITRNVGGSSGRCRGWFNGKVAFSVTSANIAANTSTDTYRPRIGIVFTQSIATPNTWDVYIDDVFIADGYTEPVL